MKRDNLTEITETWRKYELGKNHHNAVNLYEDTARAWRFYEGDQWYGLNTTSISNLPKLNFITPLVDYKFATVASQNIQITYSSFDADPTTDIIIKALNKYAARKWESQKMESRMWDAVLRACVSGDVYAYFYNKNLDCQFIDNTSIYFADEQEEDIQKQEWIIIQERRPVAAIRREAKKNGVKDADIKLILADKDTDTIVGENQEVDEEAETGKCMSLLFLTRDENGDFTFSRSTRYVEYQPIQTVKNMKLYPIAPLVWGRKKNSCRGLGEVLMQISNQIETNRILLQRTLNAKANAFPKPVYNENMIDDPTNVDLIGKSIALKGSVQNIDQAFKYVSPAPMSSEAGNLQQYLLETTRNLSNSGDAATGNVNPERAAASAIIAIQNQSTIPINKVLASFKQFVEDIAGIWFEMWKCYEDRLVTKTKIDIPTPNAQIPMTAIEIATIDKGDLDKLRVDIKIDATPTTPFSVYAVEQNLQLLMNAKYITFEEFVNALPDNATMPKNKLQHIIDMRGQNPQQQPMLPGQNPQTNGAGTSIPASQGAAQPATVLSRPTMG